MHEFIMYSKNVIIGNQLNLVSKTNIEAAKEMLMNERKWDSGRQMARLLDHK